MFHLKPYNYPRLLCQVQKLLRRLPSASCYYATTVDAIDVFTYELLQKHKSRTKNVAVNSISLRYFMEFEGNRPIDVSNMTVEEIDQLLLDLLAKSKDKDIVHIVTYCSDNKVFLKENTVKKMFRNYSIIGKTDTVILLQNYSSKVYPYLHKRNGEFMHYLAKAQCMKGNSEKGLAILKQCYSKYDGLRSFYRIIFRELIHDSVLNRSEASLMVFKKYVLEFSEKWNDHYPLVCFWHICWCSTWFSDQMLANELLESSTILQQIVQEKATVFCTNILKEYNDDAVVRLLQILLKYKMLSEYTGVLHILFNYKLKTRDLRGCTEIIRNCQVLGISLPAHQEGKYIRMLISGTSDKETPKKPIFKNFKLKF